MTPVLQAQDGTFFGDVEYDWDSYNVYLASFDSSGNIKWTAPNYYAQIATADGGVIAGSYDANGNYSGQSFTFDANGNSTGEATGGTQSWTWNMYQQTPAGSVDSVANNGLPFPATGFSSFQLANQSKNDTAKKQVGCPSTTSVTATTQESLSNLFPHQKTGVGINGTIQVGPTSDGQSWKGATIKESVKKSTPYTCPSFPFGNMCTTLSGSTGSSTFTVEDGLNRQLEDGTDVGPPPSNSFYDQHTYTSIFDLLQASGLDSCVATCTQTYSCNKTTIGTHIITFQLTRGTINNTSVTNVSATVN
jgi:hypothetical protein